MDYGDEKVKRPLSITDKKEDWLTYIRQVSGPLANPVSEQYALYVARGYPPGDAAIWALDEFGCLELQ